MRFQSLDKLEFPRLREHLLREARTEPGRERLKNLLPHQELSSLLEEQERVREMARLLAEAGRPPLPELEALSPLVKGAIKGQVLSLEEAYLLRRWLEAAEKIVSFLKNGELLRLQSLASQIPRLGGLRRELAALLAEDGSGIKTTASPRLAEIRQAIKTQEERLRRRLEALLKKYARAGWLQEELVTKRRGRYVFPFKAEAKSRVPAILHDTSASGATVYLEPLEIVSLTNELESLRLAEEKEIYRLLQTLSQKVAQEAEALFRLEEVLVELDVLQAKAAFGERIRGVLPEIRPEGEIRLLEAAHPLLLLSGRKVVPNDFVFPPERPVVIISGPNLGGKTVALKTLGLLVLMAQAAIPIPASLASVLPFFEEVLVDMGDEQDLEGEESTFSAHVKNLKVILEEAGPGKLFLLDEIGRGTDPAEGAALAMAVLEALASSGARVLATTHYEALKAFSFSREDVLPLSVSFDEETGEPTYRLLYGVVGLSRGLVLAERLGLLQEILERARAHLGQDEVRFQELMASLKKALEEAEKERKALEREREALAREREAFKKEAEEERRSWARKEAAREEAFWQKIKELEREFHAFLRELKERKLSEKKASLRFGEFLKEKVTPLTASNSEEVFPGARVRLKGMGQEGRVLRLKGGVAEVQLGPFRVEVSVKDLQVLPEEGRPQKTSCFRVEAEKDVPTSINLIGFTVEEALAELDKMLDRAFLSGKSRLTVIHGLGTGRLMRAIREYLSGHRQVARVRPGETFEGGEAVTVVELATKEAEGGS